MPFEVIVPPGSPPPLAPYSPGAKAGGFIYVSGTLAIGPNGEAVGVGNATEQTRFVLESIKAVVEAGGGSMKDIVFNQIFLKDLADYAAMNVVYKEYFPANPPARYCIQTPLVRPEFLVEIATTAYVGT
ncbi:MULTISPECIES: Rid family hydrolase [Rhodopseudomonas]|uniref:Aminoacrylate peracid reductase n=1 Tax=Rhodopseudomonas palustris TaxID=1076 RepID=A0A0D7EM38_RHOPL|nr:MULTISPECIES: Rid family hydrolase [Rhodopseudomonas]KIZ41894.1 aminoacrylate peracid reductase [Rhodopseudomonas palustris]MDF3812726.1 Rid family hydrolase [Rhodopseudomonas sp. BAL398]WOK15788.1 Rid family hydrolase [Rhodopseudomonas sp. BAL398]